VANNVAQRLGPCEEKQTEQMVGLGVDFDRETAEAFERTAHIGMEIGRISSGKDRSRSFVEKIRWT